MSTKSVMDTTGTGRRRNRSWPEALKREIVAASFAPGSSVSIVARQYDVNANQVFSWRTRYREDRVRCRPRPGMGPWICPFIVDLNQAKGGGKIRWSLFMRWRMKFVERCRRIPARNHAQIMC